MSDAPDTTVVEPSSLEAWASELAERLGAGDPVVEFDTVRIPVERDAWVDTIMAGLEELPLFSWLSAIDWSTESAVGEGVDDTDGLEERFEVLCRLSSVVDDAGAIFFTTLPKDDAVIESLAPQVGGAEWHERETHEMFGIAFDGNPNLTPLYLPDDFVGHPLLKSYPLIAREVKPWPGEVDVEDMPAPDEPAAGGDDAGEGGGA